MTHIPKTTRVLRLDVWGGDSSMDHVARVHFAVDDPAWLARQRADLMSGYLVNIRALAQGEGWGSSEEFDTRGNLPTGRA